MNLTDALPSSFFARANSIDSNFALIEKKYNFTVRIYSFDYLKEDIGNEIFKILLSGFIL